MGKHGAQHAWGTGRDVQAGPAALASQLVTALALRLPCKETAWPVRSGQPDSVTLRRSWLTGTAQEALCTVYQVNLFHFGPHGLAQFIRPGFITSLTAP